MDRGAWWATVHRVAKTRLWLRQFSMHASQNTTNLRAGHLTEKRGPDPQKISSKMPAWVQPSLLSGVTCKNYLCRRGKWWMSGDACWPTSGQRKAANTWFGVQLCPRCSLAPLGLQTNSGRELVLHKSLIEMWWGEGKGMLLKRKNQSKKNPLPWVYLPLRSFESFSKDGLVRKPMHCSLPTLGDWSFSVSGR